jgi:hypothetical protein
MQKHFPRFIKRIKPLHKKLKAFATKHKGFQQIILLVVVVRNCCGFAQPLSALYNKREGLSNICNNFVMDNF